MGLIHLIDDATVRRSPVFGEYLAQCAERSDERVIAIGDATARLSDRLRTTTTLAAPAGMPEWAVWRLRRALRSAGAGVTLVCWSAPCIRMARWAAPFLPRVAGESLTPRVDPQRVRHAVRPALRSAWRCGPADRIAVLLADRPEKVDVMGALVATGLAAETGRPWRLVVHPAARGLARARRLVEAMDRAERLIVDRQAGEPWAVLGACDAAVAVAPARWSLAWAMVGQTPIVADPAGDAADDLAGGEAGWLGEAGRWRTLARGLCAVADDPAAAAARARHARRRAASRFGEGAAQARGGVPA